MLPSTSSIPIAILGAGPSGLLLGRLLHLAGIPSTIFERDSAPDASSQRGQEGTLDIHTGTGQRALAAAGLLPEFQIRARYNQSTTMSDSQGNIHIRLAGEGEDDRPEIDRKDLRKLLLDSLEPGHVQWGRHVDSVQRDDAKGSMAVRFADGSIASGFRLVIGADGAWSKARQLVTSAKPNYSGHSYLTSYISTSSPIFSSLATLVGEGNYMAFGDRKMLVAQKMGDGGYYLALGLQLAGDWARQNAELLEDTPHLVSTLVSDEYFGSWADIHSSMIRHVEKPFRQWSLNAIPTSSLPWNSTPGVTLIGDAAHVA